MLFWALSALVLTFGTLLIDHNLCFMNDKEIISGYQGSLIAMLTYPARSKAIDTFADLLELPEEATIGTFRWSSMNEILRETSDSILKVCSPCSPNNTGAGNITSHGLGELG